MTTFLPDSLIWNSLEYNSFNHNLNRRKKLGSFNKQNMLKSNIDANYTNAINCSLHLGKILLGYHRVVNGPTSSGPNPARNYKPKLGPNPKINLKPKSRPKKPKVELELKNLAILPSYFDSFFVHQDKKYVSGPN